MKAEETTPDPREACPELEDLATLIDGRVDGEARDRLVAHVADCEACYEVFALSARLREEAREADAPAAVVRIRHRRALFALAASVLLAVALWRPWASRTPELSLASLTAATVSTVTVQPGAALADGWAEDPWPSGQRGPESAEDRKWDLRLGARTVLLDVALATGDRKAASGVLAHLLRSLDELPRSQVVRTSYRNLEAGLQQANTVDLLAVARDAAERLRRHTGVSDAFLLGQWLSAGRIAAACGAREHFDKPAVRTFFAELEAPEVSPEARREIEGLLGGELSDDRLAALERVLASVLGR